MAILKLEKYNEKREIEFELDYLASLTTRQRFELMFRKTRETRSCLKKMNTEKLLKLLKENRINVEHK
jgi:hypothetical protein